MYLPAFDLQRPRSLNEALDCRADDPDSVWYAGGTELIAVMKLGLATPSKLIDIKGILELRALDVTHDRIRIGATVTHRTLERDATLRTVLPILADLERWVANVRVRNAGSLGGNLAFAEPHSDPAPLLMALDARVELVSAAGERVIPLEDFLLGPFETAMEPDELLRAVVIDRPSDVVRAAIGRRAFRERPNASVVVVQHKSGARIAVGSAGPVARRARAAEAMMDECLEDPEMLRADARSIGEAVAAIAGSYDEPGASAEFKEHLVAVLTERAIHRMLDDGAGPHDAIV